VTQNFSEDHVEEDKDKIDQAALGLLWLTLHDQNRAWKGLDWDVLGRLHKAGLIDDPVGKTKSVHFTPEGLAAAKGAYETLFMKQPEPKQKKPCV
jgi:Domain of unknown function (DUF6429)